MTPTDLRMAAATLTGEARGRLLERADVVEDLLARKSRSSTRMVELAGLAVHFATAGHIQPRGRNQ